MKYVVILYLDVFVVFTSVLIQISLERSLTFKMRAGYYTLVLIVKRLMNKAKYVCPLTKDSCTIIVMVLDGNETGRAISSFRLAGRVGHGGGLSCIQTP